MMEVETIEAVQGFILSHHVEMKGGSEGRSVCRLTTMSLLDKAAATV